MAIEFNSSYYGIKQAEQILQLLVSLGLAKCPKNGGIRHDSDVMLPVSPGLKTKVYIIDVNPQSVFFENVHVAVRIWLNKEYDRGGIKISHQGLHALAKSMTVAKRLQNMNVSVIDNKTKKVSVQKVQDILAKVLSDGNKKVTVSVTEDKD